MKKLKPREEARLIQVWRAKDAPAHLKAQLGRDGEVLDWVVLVPPEVADEFPTPLWLKVMNPDGHPQEILLADGWLLCGAGHRNRLASPKGKKI